MSIKINDSEWQQIWDTLHHYLGDHGGWDIYVIEEEYKILKKLKCFKKIGTRKSEFRPGKKEVGVTLKKPIPVEIQKKYYKEQVDFYRNELNKLSSKIQDIAGEL